MDRGVVKFYAYAAEPYSLINWQYKGSFHLHLSREVLLEGLAGCKQIRQYLLLVQGKPDPKLCNDHEQEVVSVGGDENTASLIVVDFTDAKVVGGEMNIFIARVDQEVVANSADERFDIGLG